MAKRTPNSSRLIASTARSWSIFRTMAVSPTSSWPNASALPSPCSRRVKALEEAGIILGRKTLLDRRKLGLSLTVILQIGMDRHTPERFQEFEEQVATYPEVQELYLITGQQADYILKVVVPDMEHYQQFLLNKVTRITGVSGVHSSFVMRRVIDNTELPLKYL